MDAFFHNISSTVLRSLHSEKTRVVFLVWKKTCLLDFLKISQNPLRRIPCFYDKTNKLFKDKNANWNACAKVAVTLSLETGMLSFQILA